MQSRKVESSSKKRPVQCTVYRDLSACVYLSEARNPIPPFLTHCISYLCTYDLWALEIETFLGSVKMASSR
jgi:hypothetical protein